MNYLQTSDFKSVCDETTLQVIAQADDDNMARAESYAIEEVSSYLRQRYDVQQVFAATESSRNQQIVMITADVTLYHLVAWLPKRIGFEIRELRYKNAIEWLTKVSKGTVMPDLPTYTGPAGEQDITNPFRYGGMIPSQYDY